MQAILGAVPLSEKARRHKNTAQHSETTGKPQALFHPHIGRLIEQAVYFSCLLKNDSQFNGRDSLITQLHTHSRIAHSPPDQQKLARHHLFEGERQLNERAGFSVAAGVHLI